jgi:hypothetical protein
MVWADPQDEVAVLSCDRGDSSKEKYQLAIQM